MPDFTIKLEHHSKQKFMHKYMEVPDETPHVDVIYLREMSLVSIFGLPIPKELYLTISSTNPDGEKNE